MPFLSRGALVALVLGILCAWPQPFLERIRSPNELVRLYLVRAIVDDGSLRLDTQFKKRGPLVDHARYDGNVYCDKAPGLSLLAVPLYAAARLVWSPGELADGPLIRWFRLVLLTFPTLAFVVVLKRWLESLDLPPLVQRVTPLAYLAGTPAIIYCAQFVGHQGAAWMMGTALVAAWSHREGRSQSAWVAGLLAGAAAITEYPTVPMLAVVAWLSINPQRGVRRSLLAFASGAAAPLLLGALYHTAAFGSPFTTGYSHIAHAGFRRMHDTGLLGVGLPSLSVLWEVTFGLKRGLFILAPWLVLSFFAWRLPTPRRPLVFALALNVVLHGWVATGFGHWVGGWAVGPRHMVAALPAMAMLAALGWSRLGWPGNKSRPWAAELGRGMIAASVALCTAVALTFPGFPEDIGNPLRDFTFPLLQDLQGSHSMGTQLFGLPAPVALAVGLVLLLGLVASVFLLERPAPLKPRILMSILLAVALVGVPLLAPSPPNEKGIFRVAWLREKVWEPKDAIVVRDPRYAKWEEAQKRFKRGIPSAEDLESLAAVAERAGKHEKAERLYEQLESIRNK